MAENNKPVCDDLGNGMVGVSLKIEPYWGTFTDPGRHQCKACRQMIIGDAHALFVQFGKPEDLLITDAKLVLCDYCYAEYQAAG